MVETEQSNLDISLQHHYLSELTIPSQASLMDAKINVAPASSGSSSQAVPSRTRSTHSKSEVASSEQRKLVECPYKLAGCTAKVPKGTAAETEHNQSCQYRPIPCLMQHVCKQLVPYHNFLLHHMQHFIYPTFSRILNTSVVFEREDFDCNHWWHPRWINCYEKDFFVMISHKIPGMWYFWVWMLGTAEDAEEFSYDIEISKKHNRKLGTFPVLHFRTSEDELEKREICLSMTDYQVKRISQIKENLVGSFDMDLMIHRQSSSSLSRLWLGEKC